MIDAQNAVLPGVTIVARNEASGQYREIVSGDDGSFFMSALTPGLYEMAAQLEGFKKYQRKGVRVEVGKTISIDIQLEVGAIAQEVTGGAVELRTPQLSRTAPAEAVTRAANVRVPEAPAPNRPRFQSRRDPLTRPLGQELR